MIFEGVAVLAVLAFIVSRVLRQDKWLGSLIQLGEVQQREAVHKDIQVAKTELAHPSKAPSVPAAITPTSERVAFTLGILNIVLSAFILGAWPTRFYLWYTPKAVVLIGLRWLNFRKRGTHYLLFDFCYFANWLLLLYLWVLPNRSELFLIVFIVANGPLAWSILAFNQSLVLHNWQQITSVFIHVSPSCLTLGLRWYTSGFAVCDQWPLCEEVTHWRMFEVRNNSALITNWKSDILFYFAACYDAILFVVDRLLLRGHLCLYAGLFEDAQLLDLVRSRRRQSDEVALLSRSRRASARSGQGKCPIAIAVFFFFFFLFFSFLQKAVYMGVHLVFASFTMAVATMLFYSWYLHVLFLLTMISMSAYNASSFYKAQFLQDAAEEASKKK